MECDRISELPDSLLTQILSYLPTKDSVTTSVLSKRWEFLWLRVPVLDLKVNGFLPKGREVFSSFMCKFMEFNHNSRMQKFKIKYERYCCCRSRLVEWIGPAIDRGIQNLDIETDSAAYMPQDIYRSSTLVSLKLISVAISNPKVDVYLPCLKSMHLEDIWYCSDPLIMEKLISGCPLLEDLTLIRFDRYGRDVLLSLCVSSHTLKRFHHMFEFDVYGIDFSLEIDAPNLKYMNFRDCQSEWIVLKNLTSLLLIDIDTEFNTKSGYDLLDPEEFTKRDIIRDFLTGISSVRHMIISLRTLEVLYQYSKLGSIPKFDNLLRLEAAFSSSMLSFLPVFLESFVNLKNFILEFSVSTELEKIDLSYVPWCLLWNLECVEIKELIMGEETGKKLVRYFLENSVFLKKLILRYEDSVVANKESDIFMEILTFTKCSQSCQIIIH